MLLRLESALGVAILLAVAFLTGLPPATAFSAGGPVNLSQISKDAGIRVNLALDSTQTGTRHAVVTLADAGGDHIGDAQKVTLYLSMMDMDMGLETIPASPLSRRELPRRASPYDGGKVESEHRSDTGAGRCICHRVRIVFWFLGDGFSHDEGRTDMRSRSMAHVRNAVCGGCASRISELFVVARNSETESAAAFG